MWCPRPAASSTQSYTLLRWAKLCNFSISVKLRKLKHQHDLTFLGLTNPFGAPSWREALWPKREVRPNYVASAAASPHRHLLWASGSLSQGSATPAALPSRGGRLRRAGGVEEPQPAPSPRRPHWGEGSGKGRAALPAAANSRASGLHGQDGCLLPPHPPTVPMPPPPVFPHTGFTT